MDVKALEPQAGPVCSGAIILAQEGLMESSRPMASVSGTARPGRPALAPGTSPTCSYQGYYVLLVGGRGKPSRKPATCTRAASNVCFHPQVLAGPEAMSGTVAPVPSFSVDPPSLKVSPQQPSGASQRSGLSSASGPRQSPPHLEPPTPQIKEIEIKNWTS